MRGDDRITGLQKAAILLISLGPEKSALIFKHLKEEEIEELTLEIANTRSVTPRSKRISSMNFMRFVWRNSTLRKAVSVMQKNCLKRLWVQIKLWKYSIV